MLETGGGAEKQVQAKGISRTPEQMKTLDESLAQRMKLQADVTETLLAGNGWEKLVQKFLNAMGKDTGGIDGKLGRKSKAAIKEVQKQSGLPQTGVVDSATADALVKWFQSANNLKPDGIIGPKTYKKLEWVTGNMNDGQSVEGRKLNENFSDVKRYLDAYNKTYGEKWKIFSNKAGLFGIVNQAMGNTNSKALAAELWITEKDLARTAQKLGVKMGADYSGVTRFATIAAISLLMTGGAGIAVEIFGINANTNLHRGPNTRAILEAVGKNGNLDAQFRKVLLSKKTTAKDLEIAFDHLNDSQMIPANVRRSFLRIYGNDFFSFFGGSLTRKRKVEKLLAQFEKTKDIDKGKDLMREIYSITLQESKRIKKMPSVNKRRMKRLDAIMANLGIEATTVGHLDAKHDRITGKINKAEMNRMTAQVEKDIDTLFNKKRSSHRIPKESLSSSSAYGLALPSRLTQKAMKDVFQKMWNSKVEWDKYSILANVMRWVKQHYNIDFSARDFYNGFRGMKRLNTAQRREFNTKILSNTGRRLPQTFQWEIKSGRIAVMQINGTNVYFRDACTNVVTVLENRPTTIESRSSIPVVIPIGLGGGGSSTPAPKHWVTSKPTIDTVNVNVPTAWTVTPAATTTTTTSVPLWWAGAF